MRTCKIPDKKGGYFVNEYVTEMIDGQYYRYEGKFKEKSPMAKIFNGFGTTTDKDNNVILYQVLNYRIKPGFLPALAAGKIKKNMRAGLIAYKHYIETGQQNANIKELLKMEEYKTL
ncbi:hypothetical protein MHTCC0001_18060 [Flavobacteriaceae bacterium MHTCC 0001]